MSKTNSKLIELKDLQVKKASIKDAEAIHLILARYAEKKLLLPRTLEDIKKNIKIFKVAKLKNKVVGCCAIRDYGRGLVEIRSLGVLPEYNGHGIGSRLIKAWVRALSRKGAKKVFALTYRPHLFERQGFRIVERQLFPEKIWTDCAVCAKKDNCDEIAVLKEL